MTVRVNGGGRSDTASVAVSSNAWLGVDPQPDPNPQPQPGPGPQPDTDRVGVSIERGALYTNEPKVKLCRSAPRLRRLASTVATTAAFRSARSLPGQPGSELDARVSPARSGLPKTVYVRFGVKQPNIHRRHHPRRDQADRQLSDRSGRVARPTSAAVTAIASKRRTYRVRIRAKDATSGVAKVQFAVRSKRHPSALRSFKRISRYKGARAPKYVRVRDRAGNYSRWQPIRLTRPR